MEEVEHFSATFPDDVCGFSGTTAVHRTSVFRDTGNGTYFMNLTFFALFTADNGKSATLFSRAVKQTSPSVIDEQAGTVTIMTTFWVRKDGTNAPRIRADDPRCYSVMRNTTW